MPCFSASLRHSSTWKLCPGCAKLGAVGVSSRDVPRMLQACSLPLLAFSAFARGLYIGCVALGRFELKAVMRPAGTGAILTCSWRCKLKPHSAAACAAYENDEDPLQTDFRPSFGKCRVASLCLALSFRRPLFAWRASHGYCALDVSSGTLGFCTRRGTVGLSPFTLCIARREEKYAAAALGTLGFLFRAPILSSTAPLGPRPVFQMSGLKLQKLAWKCWRESGAIGITRDLLSFRRRQTGRFCAAVLHAWRGVEWGCGYLRLL